MPEDGPPDLGDRIVWYKNGNIHRQYHTGLNKTKPLLSSVMTRL